MQTYLFNIENEEEKPLEGQLRFNEDYDVEVYINGEWLLIDKYYELNKTKKK